MADYIKGRTLALEVIVNGNWAKHFAAVADCPDALRGFKEVMTRFKEKQAA